jgi:hypothetical protein
VVTRAIVLRACRAALVALALASALTSTSVAVAQDRELSDSPDFRVRVQAALRLGRQGGAPATRELETGLRDAHPAVRVACAVALGNLGDRASVGPLEAAARSESVATVKGAMKEAVEKLKGKPGAGGDTAASVENAKWIVQLGAMRNNTTVKTTDLDAVMQRAARNKARSIRGAMIVDAADEHAPGVMKRATERKIPVLLVDGSRASESGLAQLQARAVGGAVESAMGSVSSEIAALAK